MKGWLFRWRHLVVGLQVAVAGVFFYSAWSITREPHPLGALTSDLAGPRIAVPPGPVAVSLDGGLAAGAATGGARAHMLLPSGSLLERMNQDNLTLYREQSRLVDLAIQAARIYIERQVIPALDAASRKGRDR